MSYHILHNRLRKFKRGFLIWITLISLLVNLWLDNTRFKIFQTNYDKRNKIQIKRALNEIEGINNQIDLFNKTINNQIK